MTASVRELLGWDPAFATGVHEVDEQHMILVNTLDEASIKLARDGSLQRLEEITQDLLAYALYHFETEEALMHEYGYEEGAPQDCAKHLEQHRAFSAKVVAVRDGLKGGRPITPAELVEFLNRWLVNHILNTDKQLCAFVLARRAERLQA